MLQIDIIIPVYNKEDYLGDLLTLLLSRQDLYDKIILVDDYSTDSSFDLMKQFEANYVDKIITYHQKKNKGPHYARLKGIELSDKEFFMFVDADDLINLEGVHTFLNGDIEWEKFGVYFGNTLQISYDNKSVIEYSSTPFTKILKKPMDLIYFGLPTMSGIIVRKDIVNLMLVGECSWGEDIIFYFKAINASNFLKLEADIGLYRVTQNSRGVFGGGLKNRIQFIKILLKTLFTTNNFKFTNIIFTIYFSAKTIIAFIYKTIKP